MSEQEITLPDKSAIKVTPADKSPLLKGRTRIFANYDVVNEDNVVEALNYTLPFHHKNAADTQFLWDYYRGQQPILNREKEVRPEINNKIVENHAQEIVAFKIGYQLAEPLQYTCRNYETEGKQESSNEAEGDELIQINELNTLMFAEDKASCDRDLFEWLCVNGVGYRMIEADTEEDYEDGGAPFEIYTLDPHVTYVVYSSSYHHKPIMAVWIGCSNDDKLIYNVYTKDTLYVIKDGKIADSKAHTYKHIPIVEYKLNNARMGVFEPVLPLLDAINVVESNRLDGIEQTVQALIKFINCDIDEVTFKAMLELGAVKVSTTEGVQSDVDVIKNDLDQSQTQVTKDDLYQAVVNICGMPNRNGTSGSSSDTGAAVLLRDGWTLAESHAKSYELQFKRSERDMLRVVLSICRQSSDTDIDLRIRDIELAFNRRNYENILTKSQVLTTMLDSGKIHPELAFQTCGLFTDPEAAYYLSKRYVEEMECKNQEMFQQISGQTQAEEGEEDNGENGPKEGSQAATPQPAQGDSGTPIPSA